MPLPADIYANLRAIVAQSSTIRERQAAGYVSTTPMSRSDAQLATWCERAARGDQPQFAKRLAWDGLDADAARALLGPAPWPAAALPAWAETLHVVLNQHTCTQIPRGGDRAQRLVEPFVALARARWQTAGGCARLTPDAVRALDQHLTGVLLATLAPTLREAGSADLPLGPLLDRYPVLARLLATISDGWSEAAAEMLARLDADGALLDTSFGAPLGAVMGVEAGLSPPYRGQRRVMSL
ncbi:MAG TPA: DUF4135 domain-containing protein, partial [Chloroflexia bacterium]|nr:DUF4135 domain-containing protein [Chloroflexia bacterium]